MKTNTRATSVYLVYILNSIKYILNEFILFIRIYFISSFAVPEPSPIKKKKKLNF